MSKHTTIIQGHPDAKHFGHALAEAYAQGATAAGHEIRQLRVAELDSPSSTPKNIGKRRQP
jgi:putative NADPH-quinone reductase